MKKISLRSLILVLALICFNSCNFLSSLDSPESSDEKLIASYAKVGDGDCTASKDLLVNIKNPTDQMLIALGWTYMCMAGASADKIAASIFQYSSSSSDFTLIGQLARKLIPMSDSKLSNFDGAILAFSSVSDSTVRSVETAIASLVKSAAVLALQASNTSDSSSLTRTDIDLACDTSCSTCSNPGMSDTNVALFVNTIGDAASLLGDTSVGDLKSLATLVNSGIAGGNDVARCFIYTSIIPD